MKYLAHSPDLHHFIGDGIIPNSKLIVLVYDDVLSMEPKQGGLVGRQVAENGWIDLFLDLKQALIFLSLR
jgi:hypothetical protein